MSSSHNHKNNLFEAMQDPSTFPDYPVWVHFEINYTLSLVVHSLQILLFH